MLKGCNKCREIHFKGVILGNFQYKIGQIRKVLNNTSANAFYEIALWISFKVCEFKYFSFDLHLYMELWRIIDEFELSCHVFILWCYKRKESTVLSYTWHKFRSLYSSMKCVGRCSQCLIILHVVGMILWVESIVLATYNLKWDPRHSIDDIYVCCLQWDIVRFI